MSGPGIPAGHSREEVKSEVRDWLNSEWRPAGSRLTDPAANTRREVLRAVGEVKDIIDRAKGLLERDGRG